MNRSKAKYLRSADYNVIYSNRGKLIQVYPEVTDLFKKPLRGGCSKCKKKRIARGILTRLMELPSEGRNLELLQGVLAAGLIKIL